MNRIDIHNYPERLAKALERVELSDLSLQNKRALRDFSSYLQIKGITPARIEKYVGTLRLIALTLGKDFRAATRQDLEEFMLKFRARQDRSIWTKTDYAVTLHRFYRWLEGSDEDTPDKVSRISATIRKKDQPRIKKSELLTEADMQALLAAATCSRDRALLATTWDTGARIGEIGGLRIGDLTFSDQETVLDLRGKTGARTVLAVECTSHLLNWLQNHPRRGDPGAALWMNHGQELARRGAPLPYPALYTIFKRTFKKAGIAKKFNPHLFRHSRATWCVEHGWSTYELCRHFGWELDSGMPAVYLSLSDGLSHNKMRESYGLTKSEPKTVPAVVPCPRCLTTNPPGSVRCARCGLELFGPTRYAAQDDRNRVEAQLAQLLRNPQVAEVITRVLSEQFLPDARASGHPGSVLPPPPPVPGTASSIPEGVPSSSVPVARPVVAGSRLVSSGVLRGKATSPGMKEVT